MLKWILTIMIIMSIVFGILNGRIESVSNALISECGRAVELSISLLGSMCLWSGVMRVAEKSGLTAKIAKLLIPVIKLIFSNIDKQKRAIELISMNITANLLGLGNAATPLGIEAMKELQRTNNGEKGVANDNMIMLVIINTASLQLIPTTIATLRLKYGAGNPMDILTAILLVSLASIVVAVISAKLLKRIWKKGNEI